MKTMEMNSMMWQAGTALGWLSKGGWARTRPRILCLHTWLVRVHAPRTIMYMCRASCFFKSILLVSTPHRFSATYPCTLSPPLLPLQLLQKKHLNRSHFAILHPSITSLSPLRPSATIWNTASMLTSTLTATVSTTAVPILPTGTSSLLVVPTVDEHVNHKVKIFLQVSGSIVSLRRRTERASLC